MRLVVSFALLAALTASVRAEDADDAPPFSEDEIADLQERGIPLAPSTDPAKYAAWKRSLPAKTRKLLDRYCREQGGNRQTECNGIGPYSIPSPPSLLRRPNDPPLVDSRGRSISVEVALRQWERSLTKQQRAYYRAFCSHRGDEYQYTELCGATPLVLSFTDARVEYTAGDGTDWPTAATPWLVLDRDHDGTISSDELFGNATPLSSGRLARHGFEPLAELDSNGDGLLDARDPMFSQLLVWTDADGDRASTPHELTPLAARVESISLTYAREPYCDARRNCEGERSSMTWRDSSGLHTGSVIDIYLRHH